jgi:hypothetical protein
MLTEELREEHFGLRFCEYPSVERKWGSAAAVTPPACKPCLIIFVRSGAARVRPYLGIRFAGRESVGGRGGGLVGSSGQRWVW